MMRHPEITHRAGRGAGCWSESARAATFALALFALVGSNGCAFGLFGHHVAAGPAEPIAHGATSGSKASQAPERQEASRAMDARGEMNAHPQDPYWPYQVAQECLAKDSVASAVAALQTSLTRDPGYPPALSSLSKLMFESGQHQEAIAMLSSALGAAGDRYDDDTRQILLAEIALHQDALGRPDLARSSLAGMPKPDLKQSRSALVYVTLRGEAPDSASEMAKRALNGDSKSAVNLNNYGITRLRAGDLDAAKQAFDQAMERDPSLPGPYYNLAILEKFYHFDDVSAAHWFHAYWKLSRSDPDSLLGLFHGEGAGPAARQEN